MDLNIILNIKINNPKEMQTRGAMFNLDNFSKEFFSFSNCIWLIIRTRDAIL